MRISWLRKHGLAEIKEWLQTNHISGLSLLCGRIKMFLFKKNESFSLRAKLTFFLHLVNTELKLFRMEEPPVVTAVLLHPVVKDSQSLKRKCKDDLSKNHSLRGKTWGGGG